MAKAKTRTISYSDYLKLTGLLALAAGHNKTLKDINRAAAEITGEEDDGYEYFGCTSDAVNDTDANADALLRQIGVSVAPRDSDLTKETDR